MQKSVRDRFLAAMTGSVNYEDTKGSAGLYQGSEEEISCGDDRGIRCCHRAGRSGICADRFKVESFDCRRGSGMSSGSKDAGRADYFMAASRYRSGRI